MDLTLETSPEQNQTKGKYFENIALTVKGTNLSYNYVVPIVLKKNEPFVMNWALIWTIIIAILLIVLIWIIILFIRAPKGLKDVEPELFASQTKRSKNPFKFILILLILLLLLLIGLIAVMFIQLKPAVVPVDSCIY